jgi:hypothetical protein
MRGWRDEDEKKGLIKASKVLWFVTFNLVNAQWTEMVTNMQTTHQS